MIKVNGVEYSAPSTACRRLHVSYRYMKSVMEKNNMDEGEALEYILKTRPLNYGNKGRNMRCTVFGKEYHSRMAACRAYGLCDSSVRDWSKKKNISYDEAFEMFYDKYGGKDAKILCDNAPVECTVFGKTYKSKRSACEAYDVGYTTAFSLAKRENISFSEAVEKLYNGYKDNTRSKGRNIKECTVFGKTYPSRAAACRAYDICYNSVRQMAIVHMEIFEDYFEIYCKKHGIKEKEEEK